MNNSSLERSRKLRTAGIYAFFIIGCIIMIFPFVWMFLTSFKTVEESMMIPPDILPESWQLDNFKDAMASLPFLALYKNTALAGSLRGAVFIHGGLRVRKAEIQGKEPALFTGSGPDDASVPDFHYAPVSDAGQAGTDEHRLCAGVPWHRQRFRNLFLKTGLSGYPG